MSESDTAPHVPPGYYRLESGLFAPVDIRAAEFGGETNSETPGPWLIDWMQGGRRSHAGVRVSPQASMALSAYYGCMRAIAEDEAKLPLQVLEEIDQGRQTARDHYLWPILHDEFNDEMTAMTAREVMTHHVLGWGNAYGLIMRDRSMRRTEGQVAGIYPIHPSRVVVERDPDIGGIVYKVYGSGVTALLQRPQSMPDIIPATDMLHLKGLGPDGLVGYSVCQFAAESLGLSLAAQEYGASFFGNSGIPSGYLQHPGKLGDKAKDNLKESWLARHGGPGHSQGMAVLEEGMKFETIALPPEQAQFLGTRKYSDLDVARWFRFPPTKLGILDNAHYANMESESVAYVVDTLTPWFVRWESEINRKLLKGTPYYVKHDARALMRGDMAARAAYFRAMFMIGAYTINEIRALEDFNPLDWGDESFLQIQYAPVRKIVDGTARQPRQGPLSPSDTAARVNGHRNGHQHLTEEAGYAG
jgi:HK97 family phage portal protein